MRLAHPWWPKQHGAKTETFSPRSKFYPLVESLVFLRGFGQSGRCVLIGRSSQLIHSLLQGLVVFLQLQQAAGGQLVHLLPERLLRSWSGEDASGCETKTKEQHFG